MTARLAIVGGGKMGEALVAGLLSAGWADPGDMLVVEPVTSRRDQLAERYPGLVVAQDVAPADGAVIAVKPGDVEAACRSLAAAEVPLVLSIAAGVPLAKLEAWLGAGARAAQSGQSGARAAGQSGQPSVRVVRAMPNTPALIGCGAAAVAPGTAVDEADLEWAESILSAVGVVERVAEPLLDAVTGLSGSGPAYVFLVAEALIEAGVLNGLSRSVSRALVNQTLLGSARLLAESGEEAESLRAAVTSPGGTTAAALRVLEARAVRSALLEAVAAAADRSRELGRG